MISRGIRNNNPGNIRHVLGTVWQGQSAVQSDPAFVQFDDPVYGIRAIVRIMKSYDRDGVHTMQDAINRWAPPNENNSASYVSAVCRDCFVGPNDTISIVGSILPRLIKAIIQHENGTQPYTDEQIQQGISLA